MQRTVAIILVLLGSAAALAGCSSNESKFVSELKAAGFANPTGAHTEAEKKTKKVGGRTIKSSEKTLEAMVRVNGCDLEFAKSVGKSGYWLDELHVNGQEPDWPGYPENLRRDQVVALLASSSAKPTGFADCYRPGQP
ncbi:hypothetical protein [Amycolatopsis sp. NPDC059657]|uniref:hypothetical protein n=1 Tax=Amycolatopsis sp. NPDC059657 TaxID=3346899 RepID=UPI00366B001F